MDQYRITSQAVDSAIFASEQELKESGELHRAEKVFEDLRRKHLVTARYPDAQISKKE